jgi:ribosomal protein RSM22 (predicted rRNA methylase)
MIIQYPESLEKWWVQFALQKLGCDSLHQKEHLLVKHIQDLSDRFTKERSTLLADYFLEPVNQAAYGLFYFPQTYVRASFVLRDILLRGWKPPQRCAILDIGAGMGSASLAIASQIPNSHITALDRSMPALSILKILARVQGQSVQIEAGDFRSWYRHNQNKYDLIVASFFLNESDSSGRDWTSFFEGLLADGGIVLVLEPSLRQTSESLESWRDELAQREDLHIWAPCLHRQECPLLRSGKYWCHEVRAWQPPQSLSFVNRRLYREVHVTKYSFLAFGKTAPERLTGFGMRLVSPVSKQKRALVFSGCCTDGTVRTFRVSDRSITQDQRTLIRKWERGDILLEENKGIPILESRGGFVVQNKIAHFMR